MSTHPPTLNKPSIAPSGTDHDALPPGTRFGEFEILRVVGVGGFGIVYLAKDHSLEREVALKEYMPASLAARGAGPQITVRSSSFAETYAIGLRSFINEARLLARFDHPSLVKVYRFWEDNATAYMVMPFLQGVTLRDMRRGMAHPPDEAWIRSVIMPILSALELLHREGVYHRDIAPDNILLPPDGPPVLLDFGAARRVISDRTQSLTAILKPSYAPIEQYAEMTQLRQGPWTDLYALGAVIHYLLFGVPPAPATARAVQDDADAIESRVVPGVSPRFLEAMSWMLSIRPNQRPQSGEQLRAVLEGQADIPARGRPGITLPGSMASVAVPPPSGPAVEQAADATRVNTAYMPTYMPTARVPAPGEAKTTTFNPATQMPTPRAASPATQPPPVAQQPASVPPPSTATQAPPAAAPTPAGRGAPTPAAARPSAPTAGHTVAPTAAHTVAPTAQQQTASRGVVGAAAQGAFASRPAPPASGAQPASAAGPLSRPFPLPPSATSPGASTVAASTGPVPSAAQQAPQQAAAKTGVSSKTWLTIAAGGVGVAAIAFGAWKYSLPGASAGAEASAAASAAASTAAVVAAPLPAPTAITSVPAAASTPTAVADTGRTQTTAGPDSTAIAAAASGARARPTADRDLVGDGGVERSASAASGARVRPPGKPVPRIDDPNAPTTAGTTPSTRMADVQPFGPGTNGNANGALGPGGTNALGGSRAVTPSTGRDAVTARLPPPPAAAVVDEGPKSAREACGGRVFISLAICMDERCELPRYRATPECIGILARKHQRENR